MLGSLQSVIEEGLEVMGRCVDRSAQVMHSKQNIAHKYGLKCCESSRNNTAVRAVRYIHRYIKARFNDLVKHKDVIFQPHVLSVSFLHNMMRFEHC